MSAGRQMRGGPDGAEGRRGGRDGDKMRGHHGKRGGGHGMRGGMAMIGMADAAVQE